MSLFSSLTTQASNRPGNAPRTAGLTVLIAHPEPIVRNTLAVAVGMSAAQTRQVLEAGSASEALSQLRSNPVDIVFCSLALSDAPGVEVLRKLGPQLQQIDLALMPGSGAESEKIMEPAMSEVLRQHLNLRGILNEPLTRADVKRVMERAPVGRLRKPALVSQGLTPFELEEALDDQQIEVYYQPKVALGSRRLIGVEALARWHHPHRGLLDARQFVPLAERSGLMPSLTLHVARQALRQIAAWRSDGLALSLSLNISTAGIDDMDLPELLGRGVDSAGVSPQWVVLEFNERQLADCTNLYGVLSRLRTAGFRLAIDQFGSSEEGGDLSLLRRLDFTELKLDRVLVNGVAQNSGRRSLLVDAVELGRKLGLRVTADGVEAADDWRLLANLGCHAAQGHLISPPIAADTLPVWKERWLHAPDDQDKAPPKAVMH